MHVDGSKMRALRESKFLTQAELAELSGATESTINRIENGLQQPRISTIRKIAAALGVEPGELVEGGGDRDGRRS